MPGTDSPAAVGQNAVAAIGLMSAAMLIVPVMDIIAKYLSASMAPLQITFGRFFVQLLIAGTAAILIGQTRALLGRRPLINLLRGVLLAMAVLCFFTAVKYMSVATAISIFFVEPMILTVLAAIVLKERIGPRRIGAVVVGLAGALIILRPNLLEIGAVSLLPLATATFFALYLLLNRLYAGADGLLAIQFSAGLAGSVVLGLGLFGMPVIYPDAISIIMPDLGQIGWLIAIGAISFVGHGLVVMAFQRGEAALLAPLQYLEIVSATALGYLVFSDFPDGPTWAGIALIVLSGLYITHRERQAHRSA